MSLLRRQFLPIITDTTQKIVRPIQIDEGVGGGKLGVGRCVEQSVGGPAVEDQPQTAVLFSHAENPDLGPAYLSKHNQTLLKLVIALQHDSSGLINNKLALLTQQRT